MAGMVSVELCAIPCIGMGRVLEPTALSPVPPYALRELENTHFNLPSRGMPIRYPFLVTGQKLHTAIISSPFRSIRLKLTTD